MYDVVIVGGGPAGLSAAIYMARAKYRVLVIEKAKIGGQITITEEVVNYPGVYNTSGAVLTQTMFKQAQTFGAEFEYAEVLDIDTTNDIKKITTTKGVFETLGVILAVGANPRKIGFEGENIYQGRGVAYCATCDGEFFKNMEVYVIGGGFAAVEEGIFLTKYASTVHIICRGEEFSCAKSVAEKVLNHPKIKTQFNTEVVRVEGENLLNSITLKNNITNEESKITDRNGIGVFVFAGYAPNTGWLPNSIELKDGYIVTDDKGKTNIDGIYGAGDVCIKKLRQVVTAVSDGAVCATSLEIYVEALHEKLNIPELFSQRPKQEINNEQPNEASSSHDTTHSTGGDDSKFISDEIIAQLKPIIDEKFTQDVILKTQVGTNSELANEMKGFADEFASLSNKIKVEVTNSTEKESFVEVCVGDKPSGIKWHAVPGGHEFNSFISGLFTLAGVARAIESETIEQIKALKSADIKVLITLSCTMCPDVVVASQRLAIYNDNINTTIIDISHSPEMKEKYKVMSVPCLVVDNKVDDEKILFGKKSLDDIINLI